mgnify:CR=1 FL=1
MGIKSYMVVDVPNCYVDEVNTNTMNIWAWRVNIVRPQIFWVLKMSANILALISIYLCDCSYVG